MDEYIISDAAKVLEIEPHVLRYWEDELKLNITRNKLGHRLYTEKDIEMLQKIKLLKEKGLRLKAIKMMIKTNEKEAKDYKNKRENNLTTQNQESVTTNSLKLKQFQEFMKDIFQNSLKENNDILKNELIKGVSAEIRHVANEQEALEEKRYRKLDETIREMQKSRQEIAIAEKEKKKSFLKNIFQ